MRELYLDGWRCISILFVILSHLIVHSGLRDQLVYLSIFGQLGNLGVCIFFLISGYVITKGLFKEIDLRGALSIKAFYFRRFFRIIPPLYLYLTVIAILSVLDVVNFTKTSLTYSALFLCNIPSLGCTWLIAHTWSLAYEEQFYLVFPLLFLLFRPSTIKSIIPILYISFVILAVLLYLAKYRSVAGAFVNFNYFLAGATCAAYGSRIAALLNQANILTTVLCSVILMAIFCLPQSKLTTLAQVIISAPLIAVAVFSTKENSLKGFLSKTLMVRLGQASYGVYLWQQLATTHFANAGWTFYFCSVIATTICSVWLFESIETKILLFGRTVSNQIKLHESAAGT